jgi:hypothetical protein
VCRRHPNFAWAWTDVSPGRQEIRVGRGTLNCPDEGFAAKMESSHDEACPGPVRCEQGGRLHPRGMVAPIAAVGRNFFSRRWPPRPDANRRPLKPGARTNQAQVRELGESRMSWSAVNCPSNADCGRCPLMGSEIDYLPHWTSMRCQRQSAIVMSEDLGAQHLAVGLRNKARPQLPPMQIRLIICALGNIPVSAVCFRIQFPKCT